jgi:threonine dehydratase
VKAVIVMPHDSVARKVEATKGYGAEVVFCGTSTDDRERTTDELIAKHGYTLVHPFNDPKLIAGQGTVALEIFQELADLDYLIVPVGGGGLISGCALAAQTLSPNVKVIGVETIADGMRTLAVGELNFEIILRCVDDVITILDDDIVPMMKFFAERMKIIVEPTGAVAPAAVMKHAIGATGKRVCAVVSGGNVDGTMLKSIL